MKQTSWLWLAAFVVLASAGIVAAARYFLPATFSLETYYALFASGMVLVTAALFRQRL